ncbi:MULTISPECIES: SDR family oxidoreductase [Variovorax]|jgi:NAD(P)-dependent dehydrogenase (short-subunit alcohol dehydrogenase family)|uniref:3-ketoacyl-ACP reductase n=1 Tax=Variovorax paradoxus TaxID=34073 RepID=A0AA91DJV7_VARPD|nr:MULTISPECIES: SDR family oxidoreductase [Variovorax]AVQ84944.1 SDR family NAD(P)-dependent oxidoreductase [Variovorax sp. PMC12]OAK59288.1 3-ketoacyl-ACP reductase [Variovorax paradoxus]QRY35463.1 SDR family oxidoreductase [Variovorax sp. PDNC026]
MSIIDSLRPPPGLRVLVSAGAAGIGAAVALAFRETGARVHVCDIDRSALERLAREAPELTYSTADASVPEDVERVFDDVQGALGGLDVLVNNVGIAGPTGAIEDLKRADWERTVSVNLNSQFYFAQRAVPLLRRSTMGPNLIAMSSVAGRLGYAYRTPYASTKWAIVGLMKSLAIELGPQGVRVNAILPGTVEGERMNGVIGARAATAGVSVEAMRAEYLRKISLRRMVTVEDVAAMALFLSSPAARNLSGQAISVDGNMEYL